jgi:hypothetical protein
MSSKELADQRSLMVLYRHSYRSAISLMLVLVLIAFAELLTITYFIFIKPAPEYYAVHDNGSLSAIKPLQQPNFGSGALAQWEK